MTIFVSYTKIDEVTVRGLREDLERLGKEVWMDHEIHGGEQWWREIISTILATKVFIFALSKGSWKSQPCQLELGYAKELGIPVLPVVVGPLPNMRIPILETQTVDYRQRTADAAFKLVVALSELSARPLVLPDPLPEPPKVPFEYLYRASELLGPNPIPLERQEDLIRELGRNLKREPDDVARSDILGLLRELRERTELTMANFRDIDAILTGADAAKIPVPDGGETRLSPTDHWRRRAPRGPAPPGPKTPPRPTDDGGESGQTPKPAPPQPDTREAPGPREQAPPAPPTGPPARPKQGGSPGHWPGPQAPCAPSQAAVPGWLTNLLAQGGTVPDPPKSTPPTPSTAQWWTEGARGGPVEAVAAEPPTRTPTPPSVREDRLAFAGAVLGAMGIPFLFYAVVFDGGASALFIQTVLLIVASLGLSISVVSATRGEARSRLAVVIAAVGLVGVIVFAIAAGLFS